MLCKQNAERIVDVGQSNDISKSIKGKTMKKNEQNIRQDLNKKNVLALQLKSNLQKQWTLKATLIG